MKKIAVILSTLLLLGLLPISSIWAAEGVAEDTGGTQISAEAKTALQQILDEREVMALVYLSDTYAVRMMPSSGSGEVVSVPSGQQVQIQGIEISAEEEAWVRVSLSYLDATYEGYIQRENLACSDERFLVWEAEYEVIPPSRTKRSARAVAYPDVAQFPASYQTSLMTLKNAHPNWTFVKMNTGLDWNTVVQYEMADGRSLVPDYFDDYMKRSGYGQGWSNASDVALKYYLDPRNWINEEYIFQFEQLTYNASYHNAASVQSFLNGSFMRGTVPQDGRTYAQLFYDVGRSLGVSPFHLASRAYNEQGVNGSAMVSGTYPGYEGLYNYYNVGAAGTSEQAVMTSGLQTARNNGWTTHTKSIEGGASFLSKDYIKRGQDTLYLQKFDVDNTYDGLYWHQYMQNIVAPASESKGIRSLYANTNSLDNTFVFKIPVFNNMPSSPSVLPVTSYNVTLTPPAGYNDAKIYLDGIEHNASKQGNSYVVNANGGHATTAVMYKYDGAKVPVGMYVWTLRYNNGSYTVTAVPELTDLLTYHGFSIRITGKAGIRFKTGISTDMRGKLLTTGVSGYWLKEYGTLVMNNANRDVLPMMLGGDKISSGISYGINSSGTSIDAVYETVNGRYRYTSVLVGLPAAQYKTEFAFRGYIILTKGGKDYVLYGPPVAKSIYSLAQQSLASGAYPEGTDAHAFLQKLIQDAG